MSSSHEGTQSRSRIGVFPPGFLGERSRLFSALSSAIGADFVGRSPEDRGGLDGALVSGDPAAAVALADGGVPTLLFAGGGEGGSRRPHLIQLRAGSHLDERLHDRAILEADASTSHLTGDEAATVLALGPAGPVWLVRARPGAVLHEAASTPEELGGAERLKDRLRSGRFAALLPLVHFLHSFQRQWNRPPVRASFVFDDANLHWRSYGYIKFRTLADHAAANGYHLGIAMIPLDGWVDDAGAVGCFRNRQLSLLVHGNNHTSHELGRSMTTEDAATIAATSVRRVAAFERRTGLGVQRVMSPPHGRVTDTMMSALRRTGFDGTCYWGPTDDTPPALVGWNPADVHLGGGFPGVHRVPLDTPLDELVLRAYLDQPLLLSGHHGDLAAGMGVLSDACERVRLLGDVTWSSVSDVLATNYLQRCEGGVLRVQPFSRRFRLQPPEGSSSLVIEWTGSSRRSWVVQGGGASIIAGSGDDIPLTGSMPLEIRQYSDDDIDALQVAAAPWRPWPVARRFLTEGRDRLQPVLRPARASA